MGNSRRFRRSIQTASAPRLVIAPEIPEDGPPDLREGIARRRLVATTGRCPCGARLELPETVKRGSFMVVRVEHESDCPATDERIDAAMGS
jgi:hypothetical protein